MRGIKNTFFLCVTFRDCASQMNSRIYSFSKKNIRKSMIYKISAMFAMKKPTLKKFLLKKSVRLIRFITI